MEPIEKNCNNARMDTRANVRAYVERACKAGGWKYTQLARAAGVTPSTITRFMNKDGKSILSTRTLHKIAVASGLPEFSSENGQNDFVFIGAGGIVQAGKPRLTLELDMESPFAFRRPSPLYKDSDYQCFITRGNSMNGVWPDETALLCVNIFRYEEVGKKLKTGNYVIVQRRLNGDFEAMVKELEIRDGEYWLWPRSSEPEFQQPINWKPSKDFTGHEVGVNDGEVRITAVVVGHTAVYD